MRNIVLARFIALIWAAGIAWLLGMPDETFHHLPPWLLTWFPFARLPGVDKLVHGGLFFGLGLSLVPALVPYFGSTSRRCLAALAIASAYGVLTEMGQYLFTDRSAEIGDFAADVLGAAVAVGLIAWLPTAADPAAELKESD